ncbi:hypothetical protein TR51_25650 [Kitasatospora griseola]|uniref:Uncharacterized protein n=1 Tax=Kitasatospora griseola TaxID=2064 RepID=A0A0D0PIU9_KITGR|nr:hypothetical protein [Kitasatospora griseola]KIQ62424.1 hypothetical protein TR51_25650 [Kitasatospora griseola]
MAVETMNQWHLRFPAGRKLVEFDLAAPLSDESADVITKAYAALSAGGLEVDPFTASADLIGPFTA